jgi:hypothetical protein
VDDPDFTQLERLKGLKGDLKTLLKEYAERKYLKTCPFCGSEGIVCERIECYGGNSISPHVHCSNHDCEVAIFGDTVQDAISKWNRRVGE